MTDKNSGGRATWLITVGALIFVLVVGFLAWLQLAEYESGVMEVYAIQQDGYVQLVLDQINLNKSRSNDEIINDILGTLDASSNKYWTLSEEDTLMFVKDVAETNRYKGFTTATYYVSPSAQEFINNLRTDRVGHNTIQIGERKFVASGVQFEYNKSIYRICLLTSADIVLDQNSYLGAKINLSVLAIIELCVLVLSTVVLSMICSRWHRKYKAAAEEAAALRLTVGKLNDELNYDSMYDPLRTLLAEGTLPMLLDKIESRDAWPISMQLVKYADNAARDTFLCDSQLVMDRRVLRISVGGGCLLLVGIGMKEGELARAVDAVKGRDVSTAGSLTLSQKPDRSMRDVYREFYEGVVNSNGEPTVL